MAIFSQNPVKIGIWERFDYRILNPEQIYTNSKEQLDQKDNDKNGYIDDIHGIGFDEFEKLIPENFQPKENETDLYEHGTSVAYKIKEQCKVPFLIYGVGFEYTSIRLEKSGLLQLSVEERLKQMPKEYQQMEYFIKKSIEYFSKNKVQIVNISWGQNAEHIAEINPNFGHTQAEKMETAKDWVLHFKKYLEKYIVQNPKIIFVIAAGNEGKSIDEIIDVPANIIAKNAIIVGGLSKKGSDRADFSNFGSNIDCWAPAESVKVKNVDGKISEVDGVSVSAPYISAKIAEMLFQGKKINKASSRKIKVKE